MHRTSPLYVVSNCSGPSVTVPPLLAPLSTVDQQQQQQQHYGVPSIDSIGHQPAGPSSPSPGGRSTLKRKLPVAGDDPDSVSYPVSVSVAPYSATNTDGPSMLVAKARKELTLSTTSSSLHNQGVELHEFPAFGQAFGVSGIGQFYVLSANDSNNNSAAATLENGHQQQEHPDQEDNHQHHQHHHQDHLATYIYDVQDASGPVSGAGSIEPLGEQMISSVPAAIISDVQGHQSNKIVLTDISSSTWTSTAELLDLDRKGPTAPPADLHHRYSIISSDHQHHQHHQQQLQQQPQQQNHHEHLHHHLPQLSAHQHHHHHQQQQQQHQVHHQQQLSLHAPHHSHHHQPQQQPQVSTSPQPPPLLPPPLPAVSACLSVSSQQQSSHASQQQQQQQYGNRAPYGGNNQSHVWTGDGSPSTPPTTGGLRQTHTSGMKTPEQLASQTPDTPEDCKNLSWLLSFKLDDIPNLSPRSNRKQKPKASTTAGTTVATAATACDPANPTDGSGTAGAASGVGSVPIGDAVALAIEDGDLNVGENVTIESSSGKSPKKPPFTYTELIEYALEEQGDLTVAAIYQWISDHFPYYKSHDDRWKNSVRHNLSINPHFRKGRKSSHGSGHLWTISSRNSEDNFLAWEHKKQRFEWFFKMEANARTRGTTGTVDSMTDDEVAAATASLAQYAPKSPMVASPVGQTLECSRMNAASSEQHTSHHTLPHHQQHHHQQQAPQQQQHQQQQPITATYHQTQTLYADIISNAQFEITATAEEIKQMDEDTLNGLRRGTEIQIVRPTQAIQTYEMLDSEYNIADYLNPVPKEEIVQECGLRSVALDPAELGISIPSATTQEDDILFDEFNLSYFGNNIMT
ncbi:uncharacterized protein LOC131213445 [Anopheles bellator]|uniref:uncharacterized protein LOC131213445 n=1 Tax=Anopheles bellator TaxID=139047 RepID=UPI0026499D71|nr:uncharacterized protein LOC131213445 [Anopheles bellator]